MSARPRLLVALAVALVTASTWVLTPPAQAKAIPVCQGVPLVAHRGMANRHYTENTVRAFLRANAYGASLIETDARVTADGQWVLMHDPTLERTTGGTGPVDAFTLAQVKSVRTNDGVVGGVASLAQAFYLVRRWPRMRMQVEIKAYGLPDADLQRFVALVRRYGVAGRISVSSYSIDTLTRIRRLAPGLSTAVVTLRQVSSRTITPVASRVLIERRGLSRAYVELMHAAGVRVDTWTVNGRKQVRRAAATGVDSILTDSPPRVRRLCSRR